jgi:thioredoxin family protein
MKTITVKILGTRRAQRYCVTQTLIRVQSDFEMQHPECQLDVRQITTSQEILQYTPVIAFPSLMIAEELVCVGRFPSRKEILRWLENEVQKEPV